MRRVLTSAALVLAVLLLGETRGNAARDLLIPADGEGRLQLVLVEVDGCIYCEIFRRDVLPKYRESARGRDVPLRFVDLNAPEADELGFESPIVTVPTVVLLKNNVEVGRIQGYVGPENFFHSVHRLFSLAE